MPDFSNLSFSRRLQKKDAGPEGYVLTKEDVSALQKYFGCYTDYNPFDFGEDLDEYINGREL